MHCLQNQDSMSRKLYEVLFTAVLPKVPENVGPMLSVLDLYAGNDRSLAGVFVWCLARLAGVP